MPAQNTLREILRDSSLFNHSSLSQPLQQQTVGKQMKCGCFRNHYVVSLSTSETGVSKSKAISNHLKKISTS